jgi:predicted phage terminase large subunit-like protein
MNDPIPDQDATFQRQWLQYFDIEDMRAKEMTKVLTIDPAISLEKTADFTAMVVTGIDTFGNIFVLDGIREKLTPSQLIDKVFQLSEIWHPNSVGIETAVYQKAIAYSLRDEQAKRHRYLPIVELKPEARNKDLRIKGLQPQYQAMKIFHRRNHPLTPYLENELRAFPRGIHDDVIDAFSYSLDLLFPPKKHTDRYQAKYLY